MTRRNKNTEAKKAAYRRAMVQRATQKVLDDMAAERDIPPPLTKADLDALEKARQKRVRRANKRKEGES
jgi:hypothetical protein